MKIREVLAMSLAGTTWQITAAGSPFNAHFGPDGVAQGPGIAFFGLWAENGNNFVIATATSHAGEYSTIWSGSHSGGNAQGWVFSSQNTNTFTAIKTEQSPPSS
jgi:hypothetical protein